MAPGTLPGFANWSSASFKRSDSIESFGHESDIAELSRIHQQKLVQMSKFSVNNDFTSVLFFTQT